jgi:hypothetical protein
MKYCPKCVKQNPLSAKQCACGYKWAQFKFKKGASPKPKEVVVENPEIEAANEEDEEESRPLGGVAGYLQQVEKARKEIQKTRPDILAQMEEGYVPEEGDVNNVPPQTSDEPLYDDIDTNVRPEIIATISL